MKRCFVLVNDEGSPRYFIRLGLGIFWECGARTEAREFPTRAAAVRTMHNAGKHRQGWRVLADTPIARAGRWPLRADGTQKTMGEMTREEQDAALDPILKDLQEELASTLPRLLNPHKHTRSRRTR